MGAESSSKLSQYVGYFDARAYMAEYYSTLGSENRFLLSFYHDVFKRLPGGLRMLECGGGPTVYQLFSASRSVTEIIFTDYLPSNLREVASWMAGDAQAFCWRKFAQQVAELECREGMASEPIAERVESRARAVISKLQICDALAGDRPEQIGTQVFDIVSSGFCLECIGSEESVFTRALGNTVRWLAPGGYLLLTLLKSSSSYRVGERYFPCFPVDEPYLRDVLRRSSLAIEELRETDAEQQQGYQGLIALLAKRC